MLQRAGHDRSAEQHIDQNIVEQRRKPPQGSRGCGLG
jgi:hypothetical protein